MKIKFIPWNEISTKIERQREQEKTGSKKHTKKKKHFVSKHLRNQMAQKVWQALRNMIKKITKAFRY